MAEAKAANAVTDAEIAIRDKLLEKAATLVCTEGMEPLCALEQAV